MKNSRCGILICRSLRREIEAVLAATGLDGVEVLTCPCDCSRPNREKGLFDEILQTIPIRFDHVLTLSTPCEKCTREESNTLVRNHVVGMPCFFELFLPGGLVSKYLSEGALLLIPGLVENWTDNGGCSGLEHARGRKFFAGTITRLVLLDTGTEEQSQRRLIELAAAMGLPWEIVPVGLDMLRLRIERQIEAWRLQDLESAARATASREQRHDYAMIFDMMSRFAGLTSEEQLIRSVLDLLEALFAPGLLAYMPFHDGRPGSALTHPLDAHCSPAWIEQAAKLHGSYSWSDSGAGFIVRLGRENETLGILLVEQLALPDYREDYLNLTLTILPALVLGVLNSRHIEQLRRSQTMLQESERLAYATLHSIGEGVISTDSLGRLTNLNPSAVKLTGWSAGEALGRPVNEILHIVNAETRAGTEDPVERALNLGLTLGPAEHTLLITRDGTERRISYSCAPIEDLDGNIVGSVLVFRDMTSEIETKNALKASEAQFRLLAENMVDVIWTLDTSGRFTYVSPSVEKLRGYTPREVLSQSIAEALTPASFKKVEEALAAVMSQLSNGSNPSVLDFGAYQLEQPRKDGSTVWTEALVRPLFDKHGDFSGFLGVSRDITERKRVEEERNKLQADLEQARKLEAVGRLAGGIAHDFNNMLGVILGNTELAFDQAEPGEPLFSDLREIQKAAQRSADLTRQLLAFARKQTVTPKALDLNEALEGMLKMLRRLIGEDIDLAWLPGNRLWKVKMDPAQLDQVLANLCVNARDAISGPGRITIETMNITLDEARYEGRAGVLPGEYVLLSVSDNGCGMDRQTLAHLFEPFFTTKGVGRGTGLGLATIYGIVRQNGGFIDVESKPGGGATFSIYFPRHEPRAEESSHAETGSPTERGNETILLVEDEEAMRNMAKTMLERLGYRVLPCRTSVEAERSALEHADEIHLLMTDVVMPDMSGRELAERLTSRHPNMRSLFTSGYTADVIGRHGVLNEGVHFIQKPFSKRDLAAKVREALSARAGTGRRDD